MYSTASALIDAVRLETDWGGLTDSQCYALLNRGFLRVQREHHFWWQETSTAVFLAPPEAVAYAKYSYPTSTKVLRDIHWLPEQAIKPRVPLDYIRDFPAALELWPDYRTVGDPQAWSQYGGEYYIFPRPLETAGLFVLFLDQFFPEFTATSSNLFLSNAPDVLLHATKAEYYESSGENSKAQYERQLVADAVESVLKQHTQVEEGPHQEMILRPAGSLTYPSRGPWRRRA